jgi:ABC-type multidrug transport system ATPase subunit
MAQAKIIETRGLTRRFGDIVAVNDLNLEAPTGCVYGFLGPNGAGKTTTIRMLLGLVRPSAGEVRLFGLLLPQARRATLSRVGALVETPSIYPHLTGRENLEIKKRLLRLASVRVDRALEIVGLTDAANRRAGEYSQGMRQRLGIALALLSDVKLLILDEPTNGLDPAGIREIRDLARRLSADMNVTVFLSSHLLSEVEQIATHLGIVHQGRLLFQGPLGDLQSRLRPSLSVGVSDRGQARRILLEAGYRLLADANGYLRIVVDGPAESALVNALLIAAGVQVFHLYLEQPSLEDLFLGLTEGA